MGGPGPVEPSNFHLLPDDEHWEGARDAPLERGEESPVLLILPVRVDERLLNAHGLYESTGP